ncbi:gsk-3 [Symbiodinium pilosum]|uniref:Gsk-3 protein n=1 Tax=Symbiodinium pilosum TaxID=2952 RepID=A0A812WGU1_SYMPI|nr:gsk-3 [Symbiodinium pilosum]
MDGDPKRRRLDPPEDALHDYFHVPRRPQLHPPPLQSTLAPRLHPVEGTGHAYRPYEPPVMRHRAEDSWPPGPRYRVQCVLGKGTFGTVCKAMELRSQRTVAIKTVALNGAGREMEVLRRLNGSPNVVLLLGIFEGVEDAAMERQQVRTVNFVLEYMSDTLGRIIKHHRQQGTDMDFHRVRVYMYQLLRGLDSLYRHGVVHRDIKPANLLVDPATYTLKVCDFGTAKWVNTSEVSQAYVCSRFYRAPELILSAREHTSSVDMWAAGCVLGEILLKQPLFAGKDGIDQLFRIIEIMGTPTAQQLYAMNPYYDAGAIFTQVPALKWSKVLRERWTAEAEEILGHMLQFDPRKRPRPMEAMAAQFFGELRRRPKSVVDTSDCYAEQHAQKSRAHILTSSSRVDHVPLRLRAPCLDGVAC